MRARREEETERQREDELERERVKDEGHLLAGWLAESEDVGA